MCYKRGMTPELAAALVGLALVDATSFGTLVLPTLMLVQPRVRASRVVLYLAAISAFYFVLGVALLFAAERVLALVAATERSRVVDMVQLVVGLALLAGSFWPDLPWVKQRRQERDAAGGGRRPGWRDRVLGPEARSRTVIAVAVGAGLVEAASMLPYLGAVGMLTSSVASTPERPAALASYVVVMCLPALILLAARLLLGARVDGALGRLARWLDRQSRNAIWWVVGVVGFLIARDAASRLWPGSMG